MSLFLQRYRESPRLSRVAFWAVIVCAASSLVMIGVERGTGLGLGSLETLHDVFDVVMFVSLIVLIVTQMRARRRPR